MGVDIKLTGDRELQFAFGQLADKMQKTIAKTAIKAAVTEIVLPAAKAKCPVDTGLLRDSLHVAAVGSKGGKRLGFAVVAGRVYRSRSREGIVFYGNTIEFGSASRGLPARPFMRPALYENADKILASVGQQIGAAVEAQR